MKKAVFHLAFWILFFLLWQQVVYFYIGNSVNRFLFTSFDISLLAISSYTIFYYIAPRFFRGKNKMLFILSSVAVIVLSGLLSTIIMKIFLHRNIVPIRFTFSWQYDQLVANKYIIALLGAAAGLIIWLAINWFNMKRQIEVFEKEKIMSELTYLRTQINPHFLFNALNTIYIQMDLSKEDAKATLSSFSEMLRYQLYECNNDRVLIGTEVEYLKNYFNLQRIRLDDRYEIDFVWANNIPNHSIAPFILLPFVENMFKHVSANNEGRNYIRGKLEVTGNTLCFYGENSIDNRTDNPVHSGIGLTNVKRRLQLLYPRRHSLKIEKEVTCFKVWLEIQLT